MHLQEVPTFGTPRHVLVLILYCLIVHLLETIQTKIWVAFISSQLSFQPWRHFLEPVMVPLESEAKTQPFSNQSASSYCQKLTLGTRIKPIYKFSEKHIYLNKVRSFRHDAIIICYYLFHNDGRWRRQAESSSVCLNKYVFLRTWNWFYSNLCKGLKVWIEITIEEFDIFGAKLPVVL